MLSQSVHNVLMFCVLSTILIIVKSTNEIHPDEDISKGDEVNLIKFFYT